MSSIAAGKVKTLFSNTIRNMARDNEGKQYPGAVDIDSFSEIYSIDTPYRYGGKFLKGIDIEKMHNADAQTLKYPRVNWFK